MRKAPTGIRLSIVMLTGLLVAAMPVRAGNLVIVMDDIGHSIAKAERILLLPAPVTLGMLPFAANSAEIARRASAAGRDMILHQPMEPLPGAHVRPMTGTLTMAMSPAQFSRQLDKALEAVPGIIGVNNHTGSLLTQDHAAMRRLMRHLAGRELAFLDSRTSPATVAYAMALEARIPALKRDVFLDHVATPEAIANAFDRALAIARQQGFAVIIGHPHEMTISFLEQTLPSLPDGFEVIGLSTHLQRADRTTPDPREDSAYPHISPGP
jgi:polysaccharide deacetylase 2 family uncharacterized protein YibQ